MSENTDTPVDKHLLIAIKSMQMSIGLLLDILIVKNQTIAILEEKAREAKLNKELDSQ